MLVPPRSKWDNHATALLRSLESDSHRRKARKINRAIACLEKRSEDVSITNSRAGIRFYKYVLKLIEEMKNESERQNREKAKANSSSSGMTTRTKKRKLSKMKALKSTSKKFKATTVYVQLPSENSDVEYDENQLSESNNYNGEGQQEDNSSITSNSETSESSLPDGEDFFDQHNELCEVCATGGELLCCSTCTLVFHLSCVRPVVRIPPSNDWSCAYCVSAGLTGLKKESRARRRASQAIREMLKITEGIKKKRSKATSESETDTVPMDENINSNDDDERTAQISPPTSPDHSQSTCSDEVSNKSKKSGRVSLCKKKSNPLYDSLSPHELDMEKPRSTRRVRRQPTLFDPQACPASEWKSDGVNEWGHTSKSDQPSQRSQSKSKSPSAPAYAKRQRKVKKCALMKYTGIGGDKNSVDCLNAKNIDHESKLWCIYCKDDKSVSVCCFCGCRVCFSKHDEKNLLLCDECDGEYHIYCLTPPLTSIPKAKTWFCPSCKPKSSSSALTSEKPHALNDSNEGISSTLKSKSSSSSKQKRIQANKQDALKSKVIAHQEIDKAKINIPHSSPSNKSIPVTRQKKNHAPSSPGKIGMGKSIKKAKIVIENENADKTSLGLQSSSESKSAVDEKQPKSIQTQKSDQSLSINQPNATNKPDVNEVNSIKSTVNENKAVLLDEKKTMPEQQNESKDKALDGKQVKCVIEKETPSPIRNDKVNSIKENAKTSSFKSVDQSCDKEESCKTRLHSENDKRNTNQKASSNHKPKSIITTSSTTPSSSEKPMKESKLSSQTIQAASQDLPITAEDVIDHSSQSNSVDDKEKRFSSNVGVKKSGRISNFVPKSDGDKDLSSMNKSVPASVAEINQTHGNQVTSSNFSGMQKSQKLQRSRSGRNIKRNSFHDEVEEGEQHLRSQRYAVEHQKKVPTSSTAEQKKIKEDSENSSNTAKSINQNVKSKDSSMDPIETNKESKVKQSETKVLASKEKQQVNPCSEKKVMSKDLCPEMESPPKPPRDQTKQNAEMKVPATKKEPNLNHSHGNESGNPPETVPSSTEVVVPPVKVPRRKPGARECMQISRRFGVQVIPQKYMDTLLDYCLRGKVEHLIRMRERLDEHSRMLEAQLAGLESLVQEKGELDIVVPPQDTTTNASKSEEQSTK